MEILFGFILLVIGSILLFWGIGLRRGYYQIWYMKTWVRAWSNIYMAIPLGIAAFLWGTIGLLALMTPKDSVYVNYIILTLGIISIGSIIVGMVLPLLSKNYMKPDWFQWLEHEHRDILPVLREEAHQLGYHAWDDVVKDQMGLEEWVVKIREKRKY